MTRMLIQTRDPHIIKKMHQLSVDALNISIRRKTDKIGVNYVIKQELFISQLYISQWQFGKIFKLYRSTLFVST